MPKVKTEILHLDKSMSNLNGELHTPVYRNTAFHYENSRDIEAVFQGKKTGYSYGRQGNPTTRSLENKITKLERSFDTICFSTGMGAIHATLFSLLNSGDHIIASNYLFGNSMSLLESFKRFGISIDFVDTRNVDNVVIKLQPSTKLVFVETIANPRTQVPDLQRIGQLCKENNLLYLVDNTMTSPAAFNPKNVHASLIVNSLSKYISGHGACLGGSVTDTGLYDWKNYLNILDIYKKGSFQSWGILQIRKKGLRDVGSTLSPDSANLISLGLETLELRNKAISSNALELASFLELSPHIDNVFYPGLSSHSEHKIAGTLFENFGGLLSFELAENIDINVFLDSLKYFACSSNLGDNRSLMIPVATTIFFEIGKEKRSKMGISEKLIRLSVGCEDIYDLISDIKNALSMAIFKT